VYAGKAAQPLLRRDELDAPLYAKTSGTIAVQFMGDLFHEQVAPDYIDSVFVRMRRCPVHVFLLLTKRPAQAAWFMKLHYGQFDVGYSPPPDNVWLGVTCENQQRADERIPILLQTPVAHRWVSLEPLLGPVDITDALNGYPEPYGGGTRYVTHEMAIDAGDHNLEGQVYCEAEPDWQQTHPPPDWVVVGAESGPHRRPMQLEWAADVVRQCQNSGVPCFVKQIEVNGKVSHDPTEWPEDLRVRQLPWAAQDA
jgi:protein gp37